MTQAALILLRSMFTVVSVVSMCNTTVSIVPSTSSGFFCDPGICQSDANIFLPCLPPHLVLSVHADGSG